MANQTQGGINSSFLGATSFNDKAAQEWAKNVVAELQRLRNVVDSLVTVSNANMVLINSHTHACNGAQAGAYNCSKMQSETQTAPLVPGTAVVADVAAPAAPAIALTQS